MTRPQLLAAVTCAAGAALITAGLALIYPPAAFIAAGGAALAAGLILDFEPPARRGRR